MDKIEKNPHIKVKVKMEFGLKKYHTLIVEKIVMSILALIYLSSSLRFDSISGGLSTSPVRSILAIAMIAFLWPRRFLILVCLTPK